MAPAPPHKTKKSIRPVIRSQEEAVTVDVDGRRGMRERGAIKILQPNSEKMRPTALTMRNGRIGDFKAG
jgi:hypothetical protein